MKAVSIAATLVLFVPAVLANNYSAQLTIIDVFGVVKIDTDLKSLCLEAQKQANVTWRFQAAEGQPVYVPNGNQEAVTTNCYKYSQDVFKNIPMDEKEEYDGRIGFAVNVTDSSGFKFQFFPLFHWSPVKH
ncbi:hypothetical protein ACQY0O_008325 [Thecaphora frezii]